MSTMSTNPCPSCGRYVGPHSDRACPHCGARLTGRTSIRVVKIIAVLLATVGLAVLWFAATRAKVPSIQIGQVGATMNLAYVRLEGHCTRAPSYDPESETLSFWIEDDTGEIRISAYRAETRHIIEEGRVPALGDLVEVAGTLRIREDFLSLTINVPAQLNITRAEPVDRQIGTIVPEDQYLRVRVRGQVREVYEPYDGLTLIAVRDETGSILIAVGEDLIALSGFFPTLSTGQPVEVVATVSLYGDTPQLVPASVADIVSLSQPVSIAIEKQIGELTTAEVGQLAIARGAVTRIDSFFSGVKFTLDDGSGALVVLLWQSVYETLPDPAALDVGAEVQVQGEISQYRGELELIPELAEDVQVLAAAPPPAETTVGTLTFSDAGRVVTLRGTLGPPDPFSAGVKFILDDGTGQITLLLWSNVHEGAPEGLGAGAQVIVTGEVAEYRGELELVPRNATEIQVTGTGAALPSTPTPTPPSEIEARAIGDITPAQVGQMATVRGTLGEKQTFSAGVKFELSDGSGTIILLLWQNVYDAIPDADGLVAGATVEVTGEIEEFQGDLEIIPEADGVMVVEQVEIGD
ncbi:MAG: OB-fold nucleic acid binding domain-containing protein [Anaerolineae bacterium]